MRLSFSLLACTLAASVPAFANPLDGHWVGVFDIDAKVMFVQPAFKYEDHQIRGTVDLPSEQRSKLPLEKVSLIKQQVHFELAGPDGVVQFDGVLRGDTVTGSAAVGAKRGSFTLQRTLPAAPARDARYLGAYRFQDGRTVVLSHLGDFPQLFYTDVSTGRYAALFAASETSFYAGAGFLNPSVREVGVRFETSAKGTRMLWQEQGKAQQQASKLALREREVSFSNGDVTLSGTLVLPPGPGPHPAVVLTQMSSPAPRSAYSLQAYYFAAHGIAALMYDRRGLGKSGGDNKTARMETLADDAVAGMKLLAADKQIDAARIGTWGHSQGGWVAPLAAARFGKAGFVIAQAASAVPPAEQEIYRIENSLRAEDFSEADVAAGLDYQKRLMHWVVSGGGGRSELLAAARAGEKARWADRLEIVPDTLRESPRPESTAFYKYDPLPSLATLKAPIVYILGDKDTFVPVAKSAQLFRDTLAAAGHPDHEVWMLPNAAHGLWETGKDGGNAFINSRYWAREHYPRMTQWLVKRGLARPAR